MQGILSEASNSQLLCTILGGVALLAASVWEDSVPELWGQPFSPTVSPTLKQCLGCLAWVRNGGHIHFPSLPSLLELGIGTHHPASVPRDTHLTVLYATH